MSATKRNTRPMCGKIGCNVKIKPDEKFITCEKCRISYHITCTNFDQATYDDIKEKSIFADLIWCCDTCRPIIRKIMGLIDKIDDKIKEMDNTLEEFQNKVDGRLSNIENRFGDEMKSITVTLEQLKLSSNSSSSEAPKPYPTLSQNKKPKEPATKHTILIKPDDEKNPFSDESWSKIVKDSIEPKLKNVPVSKSVRTKDGFGVLFFPSIKQRDLAASNLKDTCKLESQSRDVKSILPKLKINGIPKDNFLKVEKQVIKQAIIDKNTTIKELVENHGKTLEVLFFNDEQNTKYCFAVIKVDVEVKNAIFAQGKKIFIGLSSCRITERHHIIQCYKCHQFGHKKR